MSAAASDRRAAPESGTAAADGAKPGENRRERVDTRTRILDAARETICSVGVDAASLGSIADAAGISRGTLFYHFPAKEDLVLDVVDDHMAEVTSTLVAAVRERGGDVASAAAMILENVARDDARSRMHFYLLHEVFRGNDRVRSRMEASYRGWVDLVAAELSRMGMPDESAENAGRALVAAVDGLIIQRAVGTLDDAALSATARAAGEAIAKGSGRG